MNVYMSLKIYISFEVARSKKSMIMRDNNKNYIKTFKMKTNMCVFLCFHFSNLLFINI